MGLLQQGKEKFAADAFLIATAEVHGGRDRRNGAGQSAKDSLVSFCLETWLSSQGMLEAKRKRQRDVSTKWHRMNANWAIWGAGKAPALSACDASMPSVISLLRARVFRHRIRCYHVRRTPRLTAWLSVPLPISPS